MATYYMRPFCKNSFKIVCVIFKDKWEINLTIWDTVQASHCVKSVRIQSMAYLKYAALYAA